MIDTSNWNPVHFATFYKQKNVLVFFQQMFGLCLDIRYAMQFTRS